MSWAYKAKFSFTIIFVRFNINQDLSPNLIPRLVALDFCKLVNGQGVEELVGHEHCKTAAGYRTEVCVPFNFRTVFCVRYVAEKRYFYKVVKWDLIVLNVDSIPMNQFYSNEVT